LAWSVLSVRACERRLRLVLSFTGLPIIDPPQPAQHSGQRLPAAPPAPASSPPCLPSHRKGSPLCARPPGPRDPAPSSALVLASRGPKWAPHVVTQRSWHGSAAAPVLARCAANGKRRSASVSPSCLPAASCHVYCALCTPSPVFVVPAKPPMVPSLLRPLHQSCHPARPLGPITGAWNQLESLDEMDMLNQLRVAPAHPFQPAFRLDPSTSRATCMRGSARLAASYRRVFPMGP
jgi:hypothetical protein